MQKLSLLGTDLQRLPAEVNGFTLPAYFDKNPQELNSLADRLRAKGFQVEMFHNPPLLNVENEVPYANREAATKAFPQQLGSVRGTYNDWLSNLPDKSIMQEDLRAKRFGFLDSLKGASAPSEDRPMPLRRSFIA